MPIQQLEAQLQQAILVLEQLLAQHELFLKNFSTAISSYIQTAEITKALGEAAGAEIEAKGRAGQQTIFGKTYSLFDKRRGKGLAQYTAEKAWAASSLLFAINKERSMISVRAREDFAVLQETMFESRDIAQLAAEYKGNKAMQGKIRKIYPLLKKSMKAIETEAARDKELQATANREVIALQKTMQAINKQGSTLRGMTWLLGAGYYYKSFSNSLKLEPIYFKDFIQDEVNVVDDVLADAKAIFSILQQHIALQKSLGTPSPRLAAEAATAKTETAEAKKLRQITKTMANIQKKLRKVREAAAKFGVKVNVTERSLLLEEQDLARQEKKLGVEMGDVQRLLESLTRFGTMISSLSASISSSEYRLKPILIWINQALLTSYKVARKNPAGALRFLDRAADFGQKALVPSIRNMDEREREFYKELLGEESVVLQLERDFQALKQLEKVGFSDDLRKLSKSLTQLLQALHAGQRDALKEIDEGIRDLRKDLAEAGKMREPGTKPTGKEVEISDAITELTARKMERLNNYGALLKELDPALRTFNRAISISPKFDYSGGFLFNMLGFGLEKRMLKGTKIAAENAARDASEESAAMQQLNAWLQNKTNLQEYGKFCATLEVVFREYLTIFINLYESYSAIARIEGGLALDIQRAERSLELLQEGMRMMQELAGKYGQAFGENSRNILAGMVEILSGITSTIAELKRAQTAVATCSHMMPGIESQIQRAREGLPGLQQITKESGRNAKTASKFFGKEVQMRFT